MLLSLKTIQNKSVKGSVRTERKFKGKFGQDEKRLKFASKEPNCVATW